MRRPSTVLLGLVTLTCGLLAGAGRAGAATVDVGIAGNGFSPSTVNIQVGDTVRWTNDTGTFHDVKANDNSYGNTAGTSWTFTHTFSAPGSFGYYCSIHGFPGGGMAGTVVVSGGTSSQPGTLRFSQASYSANESAGTATITVQRIDGDDGAVSVFYTASAGTATAGADFTTTSGTLSWADNDDSSKSFAVTVLNDALVEPNETVLLALSNAGGGAAIDPTRQTATLQIVDDDVPTGGNPPAAPTNLQATAQSTTSVALSWTDNASNETGFRLEGRTVDGAFAELLTVGANVTTAVVPGLTPSTFYLFRVRASGAGGTFSSHSNEASATTDGIVGTCVAGTETLCITNGRFRTEVALAHRRRHRPRPGGDHPDGPRLGTLLLLRPRQHRAAGQGAQRLRLRPLLGLLLGDHQRRVRADGDRHPDRQGEELLQPAQPRGAAGAGHRRLRDLSLSAQPHDLAGPDERDGRENGRDERAHLMDACASAQDDDTQLEGADVLLELEVLVGRQEMGEACEDRTLDELAVLKARPPHSPNGADEREAELIGQLHWQ